MTLSTFKCPACKAVVPATGLAAGASTRCPACAARVRVPSIGVKTHSMPQSHIWEPRRKEFPFHLATFLALASAGAMLLVATPDSRNVSAEPVVQEVATAAAPRPLESTTGGDVPREETQVPTGALIDEVEILRARNSQLAAETSQFRAQFEGLANWMIQTFRGKIPLKERFVPNLLLASVNEDFSLHGDLMDFLEVTGEEKVMVDDALVATATTMMNIESSIMTVTQAGPDHVRFNIPPYPEQGTMLKEDLYGAVEATIGAQRFDRLVDVGGKDLEKQYHYFGNAERTLEFEVAYPKDRAQPPFLVIRDAWVIPDGESSRRTDLRETSTYELPSAYFAYADWLPQNVAAFARP